MDYEKIERTLEKKDDKELREIIKKAMLGKKITNQNLRKVVKRVWELKEAKRNLEAFIRTAKIIRGERKGKSCPALEQYTEFGWKVFKCKVREQRTIRANLEEIYRDFCHSCRLTHEKAKAKMTWKGVFENK